MKRYLTLSALALLLMSGTAARAETSAFYGNIDGALGARQCSNTDDESCGTHL